MTTISSRHPDPEPVNRALPALPLALLFTSALPDAMVVPVLHDLMVQRYGVTPAASHAFMCINLVGALAATGAIVRFRDGAGAGRIIAAAALLNGLLLAVMALPIGFVATLAVRFIEGAADLVVYAFLFEIIARAGSTSHNGRRMGAAATCLMLGIAGGVGVGGVVGRGEPLLSLWLGAAACLLVAPTALILPRREARLHPRMTPTTASAVHVPTLPLWPALVMMFSDRAIAGVLISTVPLFLASVIRLDSHTIGGLIGVSMLMTALGAWPAGRIADRIGPSRLRLLGGFIYAGGFAGIVLTGLWSTPALAVVMIALGLAGAALFAASLTMVVQSGRGPAGMAAYHTAGNLGFLVGPALAGTTMKLVGSGAADIGLYAAIIGGFSLLHALSTAIAFSGVTPNWRRMSLRMNVTTEPAGCAPA